MDELEQVRIPIDGTLDLHTFSPREIGDLVPYYLAECRKKHIYQVRVVHGKGTGALRRSVHSILEKIPWVAGYKLADMGGGAWGATLVYLSEDESLEDGPL